MLNSSRKTVLAALALAVGVFLVAPVCGAGARTLDIDALGLASARPLADAEMDQLRGAGFFSSFLQSLINALPPDNTVSVTVGPSPTTTMSGSGAQTLSYSDGTTNIQTNATTSGSVSPPPPINTTFAVTTVRTRTFSFSSHF